MAWAGYHVVEHPIDTTFAMYRQNIQFVRLVALSLRAYTPYAAVHVDWYADSSNRSEDKLFYVNRQSGVNNWRSTVYLDAHHLILSVLLETILFLKNNKELWDIIDVNAANEARLTANKKRGLKQGW